MISFIVRHIDADRSSKDTYQVEMRIGKFEIEVGPVFTSSIYAELLARKIKRILTKEVSDMPKKKPKKKGKKVLGY